jgi:RNA polymerase sigma-32 factor
MILQQHHDHHQYVQKVRSLAVLSLEEEYKLAKDWRENQDQKAMEKLAAAHLKLVAKVAVGYRGYGLPISDLIAEGNIGMMQAMKHYEPDRGFRFSTYAMWWIKASMQDYILHTWSLVKIGTTAAQKKLFFSLKKTKRAIIQEAQEKDGKLHSDQLTSELVQKIALKLNVSEDEVWSMEQRIASHDSSLNTPINDSESTMEWMDWLADESDNQEIQIVQRDEFDKRRSALQGAMKALNAREQEIIIGRRLDEPPKTLEEMSQNLTISRERVRQLEISAFEKLKKALQHSALQTSTV